MLQEEVIEVANTEWTSHVVFAPKKDGSDRLCVGYRKLNAATMRDSFPLQRIDYCIDYLRETRILSTKKANSRYWRIDIDERDSTRRRSRVTMDSSNSYKYYSA